MLDTTIEITVFQVPVEYTCRTHDVFVEYVTICSIDDEGNIEHKEEYFGGSPKDLLGIEPGNLLFVLQVLRDEAEARFQKIINAQLQHN